MPTAGTPATAASPNPEFSQLIAIPRLWAGNMSPTAAITLAGPKAPKAPAAKRASSNVAKLLARPARIVNAPMPASARTMHGRRPRRSDRRPVNGAPSAQGKDIAAASRPACPSGTPSSRDRSSRSGATMVIAVTSIRMTAAISTRVRRSCSTALLYEGQG